MPFLIFIFLVIVVILDNWAKIFPWLILGIGAIAAWKIVKFLVNENEKVQRRQRDEEAARRRSDEEKSDAARRKREEEERLRKELERSILTIRSSNIARIESIPRMVEVAGQQLREAEQLFQERLYYPFWDKLEDSTRTFSKIQDEMHNVERDSSEYVKLSTRLGGKVPAFPASSSLGKHFSHCRTQSDRVQAVVRLAHSDHQFASIYATRMTNNILKSGFSNLIQTLDGISAGIDGIGHRLTDGFEKMARVNLALADTISNVASEITAAVSENTRSTTNTNFELVGEMKFQNASILKMNAESAHRQQKAIEMLDRIQRKEKPPPRWISN